MFNQSNFNKIEVIENCILELTNQRDALIRHKEEQESKEWISINNITLEDIERPEFQHWHISLFIEFLKGKDNCKKFCEWNGRIYYTNDVIQNIHVMTPGLFKDVKM